MPHQSCKIANYEDEVMILEKVIVECMKDGSIVVIGDGNISLSKEYGCRGSDTSSRYTKVLMNMFKKYDIVCADLQYGSGPCYTYEKAGNRTYIDHSFISRDLVDHLSSCSVIEDTVQNVSDHLPIDISLRTDINISLKSNSQKKRVAWSKLNPPEIEKRNTSCL